MTAIKVQEYFAVSGSPFNNKDASKIGPVLQELSQQGGVTARDVLDAARSGNSPLHGYFEWEDKLAADEYRLIQARSMLRSIKVRYTDDGGERKEARAFQIQRTSAYEPVQRSYRSFQVMHSDSAFAAQMMDSAIADLAAWKRKYQPYVGIWENFGDVFQQVLNQIDEFEEECATESVSAETDFALQALLAWREDCAGALQLWTKARDQVKYIMEAIGEAEKLSVKMLTFKERDCMKCGKSFKSIGPENRVCKVCHKNEIDRQKRHTESALRD